MQKELARKRRNMIATVQATGQPIRTPVYGSGPGTYYGSGYRPSGGYRPYKPGESPGGTSPFGQEGGPSGGNGFDPCAILFPSKGPEYEVCRGVTGLLPGVPGTGGPSGTSNPYQDPGTDVACREGTYRVGDQCVAPGDIFPGGDPFLTPAGGVAVVGSFGLPAIRPAIVGQRASRRGMQPIRQCPTGMVLGRDNLCYPRQVLPRRSKYRKWRGDPRPKVSAQDWKTLQRAESVKGKVKEVAKTAGYSVKRR